jgi:uncharacterized membrane protein YagU involved in acid resistance
METIYNQSKQKTAAQTILWSGLISGAVDATAGVVVYWIFKGLNPLQVLQYIASGIFGPQVINGSFFYVIVGLVLHFAIAFAFAIAYYLAFPFIRSFAKNTYVNGLLYGAFIWVFMNYLVLPNSNIPHSPKDIVSVLEIIWHMALVGLPIAIIIEKKFKN